MPGQSHISSLLSLTPRADAPRSRSTEQGDGFRQVFEGSARPESTKSLTRARPRADEQQAVDRHSERRADSASERAENRRTERGTADQDRVEHRRAEHGRTEHERAEQKKTSKTRDSQDSEATRRTDSSTQKSDVERSEETSPEDTLADAEAVLSDLSQEEWSALSEDVSAILSELKTQVEGGDLDPELEEALRQLLADLEDGVPLDDIALQLEAIPLAPMPELASRFAGAQNLRDVLGRSGAAYLSQLSALSQQNTMVQQSAGQDPDFLTPMLGTASAVADDAEGLDFTTLLDANKVLEKGLSEKGARNAFSELVQSLTPAAGKAGGGQEASSNQSAINVIGPLEQANRSQPLAPTERGFTVQSDVRVPVGQGQWGEAVGQKVLWMAAQKLGSAELRLDPPDLGPMQVRVNSNHDQVTVTFTSPQAGVREALDQNANRLREMFADQGLNLVDVNVSDGSSDEQMADDGQPGSGGRGHSAESDEPEGTVIERIISDRLVDHYA